ncbi:MAG: hypothetical protein ACYDC5_02900 [Candidatus Dormibacteria bacterium]
MTGPQRLVRAFTAGLSEADVPVAPAGMFRPIAHDGLDEGAELGDGAGSSHGASGGGCRPS